MNRPRLTILQIKMNSMLFVSKDRSQPFSDPSNPEEGANISRFAGRILTFRYSLGRIFVFSLAKVQLFHDGPSALCMQHQTLDGYIPLLVSFVLPARFLLPGDGSAFPSPRSSCDYWWSLWVFPTFCCQLLLFPEVDSTTRARLRGRSVALNWKPGGHLKRKLA